MRSSAFTAFFLGGLAGRVTQVALGLLLSQQFGALLGFLQLHEPIGLGCLGLLLCRQHFCHTACFRRCFLFGFPGDFPFCHPCIARLHDLRSGCGPLRHAGCVHGGPELFECRLLGGRRCALAFFQVVALEETHRSSIVPASENLADRAKFDAGLGSHEINYALHRRTASNADRAPVGPVGRAVVDDTATFGEAGGSPLL